MVEVCIRILVDMSSNGTAFADSNKLHNVTRLNIIEFIVEYGKAHSTQYWEYLLISCLACCLFAPNSWDSISYLLNAMQNSFAFPQLHNWFYFKLLQLKQLSSLLQSQNELTSVPSIITQFQTQIDNSLKLLSPRADNEVANEIKNTNQINFQSVTVGKNLFFFVCHISVL